MRNVVIGQKITTRKKQRARELRRNMTPDERMLWEHLRANRLNGLHFRRQQIIAGFIVDFYCHAAGLVVEVDGPVHDRRSDYDAERDAILAARGLRILRISNVEIQASLAGAVKRIAVECEGVVPSHVSPLPAPGRGQGRG